MARTRTRIDNQEEDNHKVATVSERRRPSDDSESENGQVPARKDRPTPSAAKVKRGPGSTGLINRIPVVRSVVAYLRGVASEMQKVTWPTREESTRLTTIVLAVTISFAVGLGTLDAFMGWWFRQAFHANTEWIFLVIAAAITVLLGGGYFSFRNRI